MEVYVPYIVGSSISAFLGNMTYSYIYSQSYYGVENNINNSIEINTNEIDTNSEIINMNDFCLIDEKLNESEVNYTIDRRTLGTTLKEKMVALQSILKKNVIENFPSIILKK